MSDTQTAENAETHVPADIESRARAQGWRPKDEFKGPPEKWRDAATFVEVSEQFLPVATQQNRALADKFAAAENKILGLTNELADVKQVLTDFRDFATRGEQRAYERAMKDLVARRDVAVEHADKEAFKAVDAEIEELNRTGKPAPAAKPNGADANGAEKPKTIPQLNPAIVEWVEENAWFNNDTDMRAFAQGIDQYLQTTKPGLSIKDRLAQVKARTMKEYPDKFGNPARDGATTVATPNGSTTSRRESNKHTYENLPAEAKKACDKFVKTIPGFKREEYLAKYEWE